MQPLSKTSGLGVTFDSSATKPAPTKSEDTDICGRPATQGQDGGRWPVSCTRGGRERSSIRKTDMLMPHQEGGCSAGASRNPSPSSTSGSKGASTNPLESIANYRSRGWKKDLSHILRGFYLYNYPSKMEVDWEKLRVKFLNHLGQCQDKWKTIKEEAPLEYMPYMEHQFLSLTGIRLQRLSQFTGWIKPGSYYHGVVTKKCQLSKCLHLAGIPPPMRPQICPSETQALTQRPVETPTASPHMPGQQGVATQGACSDVPTPMEMGGAGDGRSWADQVEACPEEEWRRDRLAKCPQASSMTQDPRSINPLRSRIAREDTRLCISSTAILVSSPRCHDVAAHGIATHHPELEAGATKSLNNMVLCMISEYHITCLCQGPSYVSLVLPEAARDLLPPLEEYKTGSDFQGTWDTRVLERVKTLQVAVWLHRLDMATARGKEASYSLDTSEHYKGPLLEFFLAPQASNLTFEEVVHWVLGDNWDKLDSSLNHFQELQAQLRGELEDLQWACKDESSTSAWRRMKEMEQKQKNLQGLKATISEYESHLIGGHEDYSSDSKAEGAMAITLVADNAPSVSAAPESLASPLGGEQTRNMEVDDGDEHQAPASPHLPRGG